MITAAHVRERLREVPFQPFRIITSSGTTYDVTHPDSVFVTRNVLYVGVYRPVRPDMPDRAASVSVLHITDLQPVDSPAPTTPTSNS
jgi:hypothetical protein